MCANFNPLGKFLTCSMACTVIGMPRFNGDLLMMMRPLRQNVSWISRWIPLNIKVVRGRDVFGGGLGTDWFLWLGATVCERFLVGFVLEPIRPRSRRVT